MKPKKLKCKFTSEMLDDLKNCHGFSGKNTNIDMLYYEYTTTNNREIELIKEHTEIDYEDGNHFIYSMSKKQLRKIKLGAIEGIIDYSKMKKIIFHSELIRDVSKILEMKLSKEISKEIDKDILKNILKGTK